MNKKYCDKCEKEIGIKEKDYYEISVFRMVGERNYEDELLEELDYCLECYKKFAKTL